MDELIGQLADAIERQDKAEQIEILEKLSVQVLRGHNATASEADEGRRARMLMRRDALDFLRASALVRIAWEAQGESWDG